MKVKFSSDDDLPVDKPLKFYNLIIIVRPTFKENGKYYPEIFLDECFYEL